MNSQPVLLNGTSLGELFDFPEFQIFFGSARSIPESLETVFQKFSWARNKQVHGNTVLKMSAPVSAWTTPSVEADGMISYQKNLALAILTADCMPVMIWDPKIKIVASIHAGWKGVANRILPETIKALKKEGSRPEDLHWFIGPHIQEHSFEVGQDVAKQLCSSASDGTAALRTHPNPEKAKINLSQLAQLQIREFGSLKHFWVSSIDTLTDPRYASFRRDAQNAGRQISFITLKS